jgi:hypothetical protein
LRVVEIIALVPTANKLLDQELAGLLKTLLKAKYKRTSSPYKKWLSS